MAELVTLHTQEMSPARASVYLDRLRKAVRSARLNNVYPDARALQRSLATLRTALEGGIYQELYVDSRAGLPNMASLTRVLTDQEVAADSLKRMGPRDKLQARAGEAEVFERLIAKHDYYSGLSGLELAPVDHHRVLLRRHDPAKGQASFRIELTKLDGSGVYLRLSIELTQVASMWRRKVIELDENNESAAATQAFRSTVYRCAHLDAETIFVRLHGIQGVTVERVQRGVIGPALYWLPKPEGDDRPGPSYTLEAEASPLGRAWFEWLAERYRGDDEGAKPEMLATFATDFAALDVREEKSNDPLSPLLENRIEEGERARYASIRERYPFKVYKDRKFVVTPGLRPLVTALTKAAGTRNLVYNLR